MPDSEPSLAERRATRGRLLGGGPEGNERLTAGVGAVLVGLLAVEGITIVFLRSLLSVHFFVGMLLIPPVGLKLASTGYRFARYYVNSPPYRRKGPPPLVLRAIAPIVALSTVAVLATGVALLVEGPHERDALLPLHKVSFIVWLPFTAVHVLGHLRAVPVALRADYRRGRGGAAPAGRRGRQAAVTLALVAGLAVALAVLSLFGVWLRG